MSPRLVLAGVSIVLLGAVAVWRLSPETKSNEARSSESAPAMTPDESPPLEPKLPALPSPARMAPAVASNDDTTPAPPPPPREAGPRAPRTTDELVDLIGSKDDFVVVDALDDLVEKKETRALSKLTTFDIKNRPHAAPTVIDALGRLGGIADANGRRSATDRLLALLAQEKTRNEPESAGNVLTIYSALGRTQDPRAAAPLEQELLDPNVRLAAKTVIIESLVQLKQPTSSAALRTLEQQLATVTPADKMEEDILRELLSAIKRALPVLP